MARYIDAEKINYDKLDIEVNGKKYTSNYLFALKNDVDKIPPADVQEVKHGKWIKCENADFAWCCSNCKCGYTDNRLTYCYDCGAKMDL